MAVAVGGAAAWIGILRAVDGDPVSAAVLLVLGAINLALAGAVAAAKLRAK